MFKNHSERITTGIALVVGVLIIGYIDSFFLTWAFLGLVYILAFREALKLFGTKDETVVLYAGALWLVALFYPKGDDLFMLAGVIYGSAVAYNQKLSWRGFVPFIYPTVGMLFIFTMYQEFGMISLLWMLVAVAMTDVGAYVVGKSIGKTKFCETSPNKTMEGVVGGVMIATISGSFVGMMIVDFKIALMVSFGVALSSIFGDLYESSLKRKADVKDSGSLLPGHGGVLDRIDGYLFGGIVMLILLRGLV